MFSEFKTWSENIFLDTVQISSLGFLSVYYGVKMMSLKVFLDFWEEKKGLRDQIRIARWLGKRGLFYLFWPRHLNPSHQSSVNHHIVMVVDPAATYLPSDSAEINGSLRQGLFFSLHIVIRRDVDVPSRCSSATASQPYLKSLCHLYTCVCENFQRHKLASICPRSLRLICSTT